MEQAAASDDGHFTKDRTNDELRQELKTYEGLTINGEGLGMSHI
jgi:hypothetical protein